MQKKLSIEKIYFYLFIFLISTGIVMIIVVSMFIYRLNIQAAMMHYKSNLEMLVNTVSSSFWIHQELTHIPGTVENFLYQSAKIPGIVFVRILNNKGIVEKSADKKDLKIKMDNPPVFSRKIIMRDGVYKGKSIKEFSVKSSAEDNLWMGVSFEIVKRNAVFYTVLLSELMIMLFGATAMAIFFIFRKFIILPLSKLTQAFGELKNKDYNKSVLDTGDAASSQMDIVFTSFNTTVEKLKTSEENLKKSSLENVKKLEHTIKKLEDDNYEFQKVRANLEDKLKNYI